MGRLVLMDNMVQFVCLPLVSPSSGGLKELEAKKKQTFFFAVHNGKKNSLSCIKFYGENKETKTRKLPKIIVSRSGRVVGVGVLD